MRNKLLRFSNLFLILISVGGLIPSLILALDRPSWSNETIKQNGKTLNVVCDAEAPAKDIAFRIALDQCRGIAASQLQSNIKVNSISMQTESTSSFHEEVSSSKQIKNLLCNVKNQFVESLTDKQHVYIQCEFDLSKAIVEQVPELDNKAIKAESVNLISNEDKSKPIVPTSVTLSNNKVISSKSIQLIVSTIPSCSSIIIKNKSTNRVIECTENPINIFIIDGDIEAIFRPKDNKYLPRHIKLNDLRLPTSMPESLEVHFELAQ